MTSQLFNFMDDTYDKRMMVNGYDAVTLCELWDFMKEDIFSYSLSTNPKVERIYQKMQELGYNGHSGASFGITMRNLQFIATEGIEAFKSNYLYSISTDGKFNFIKEMVVKKMLVNAFDAIVDCNMLGFMREDRERYLDHPEAQIVRAKMEELGYTQHSNETFEFTMRIMHMVANKGIMSLRKVNLDEHKDWIVSKQNEHLNGV